MTEQHLPLDDLGPLAQQAMKEKREEVGDEGQTRELFDVPTEDPGSLAREQEEE